METLPPRSQDPRCATLGEQPPAHPGRNLQALTSPQEEETSRHHGTHTRGREPHTLLATRKPRGPHKHFPLRPKLHSKPLHRRHGLACVYAGRQGQSKCISGCTKTHAACHLSTGFVNKFSVWPPVPSPVHFHCTFFIPCHFLPGTSVLFNI